MQRIILDSTYLLPLIGIDVGIPDEELRTLFLSKNKLFANEISIFEVLGKGLREIIKKKLPSNRFQIGLSSLRDDDSIHLITLRESLEYSSLIAQIYLSGLTDIPDCIILGTAIKFDILLTESQDIPQIATSFKEFHNLKILNWVNFKKKILKI